MALSREEISARYGAALFGYCQDNNSLDNVYSELQVLKTAILDNPRLSEFLSSPVYSMEEKKQLLKNISADFSQELQQFLELLLDYGRFAVLPDIVNQFNMRYNKLNNIAFGKVISAVKLDDEQLHKLGQAYAEKYDLKELKLTNQVDPSIIGGVILEVEDYIIDGSVKNKLKKIHAQLVENI